MSSLHTSSLKTTTIRPSSPDIWHPPPDGCYKLNFDGASKGNPGQAGFGGAIRNHRGDLLWTYWGNVGWDTNNVAELEGLLAGIALVERLDLQPVILEGDSQVIITLATKLQQGHKVDRLTKNWKLEFRVECLADTLGRYRHCAFSHVRRRANRVADMLANLGVMVADNFAFTKWPPHSTADRVHHVTRDANNDKEAHEG